MNFIERVIRFCQGIFRKKTVKGAQRDIAAIRQNRPSDERDVDVAEGVPDSEPSLNGGFDDKDKSGKKANTRAKKAGGST
jgi:hypothetical protein